MYSPRAGDQPNRDKFNWLMLRVKDKTVESENKKISAELEKIKLENEKLTKEKTKKSITFWYCLLNCLLDKCYKIVLFP